MKVLVLRTEEVVLVLGGSECCRGVVMVIMVV